MSPSSPARVRVHLLALTPGFDSGTFAVQVASRQRIGHMNKSVILLSVFLLAAFKIPVSCGSKSTKHKPSSVGTNAPATAVSAKPPGIPGQAGAPLQAPMTGPTVRISSPLKNEEVTSSDIGVFLKVSDLPTDQGAHVHVMIDNQPPEELPDPQMPVVFGQLGPGRHVVRAFACDANHVSFKNPMAFAVVVFAVAGTGSETAFDPALPTLTFNLPGPQYQRSEAKKLPVDFFVTCPPECNITGWRVRVSADGEQKLLLTAATCVGATLPPLEKGDHAVRLELLDADGRLMKANFAWSERTVRVR